MFSLSMTAARQIHDAAQSSNAQNLALRIAARVDADGSVEYGMGFDETADEDLRLDLHGVAVVIGEAHQALLDQTLLDYVEMAPGQFNFIFMDAELAAAEQGKGANACTTGGCGAGACGTGSCH